MTRRNNKPSGYGHVKPTFTQPKKKCFRKKTEKYKKKKKCSHRTRRKKIRGAGKYNVERGEIFSLNEIEEYVNPKNPANSGILDNLLNIFIESYRVPSSTNTLLGRITTGAIRKLTSISYSNATVEKFKKTMQILNTEKLGYIYWSTVYMPLISRYYELLQEYVVTSPESGLTVEAVRQDVKRKIELIGLEYYIIDYTNALLGFTLTSSNAVFRQVTGPNYAKLKEFFSVLTPQAYERVITSEQIPIEKHRDNILDFLKLKEPNDLLKLYRNYHPALKNENSENILIEKSPISVPSNFDIVETYFLPQTTNKRYNGDIDWDICCHIRINDFRGFLYGANPTPVKKEDIIRGGFISFSGDRLERPKPTIFVTENQETGKTNVIYSTMKYDVTSFNPNTRLSKQIKDYYPAFKLLLITLLTIQNKQDIIDAINPLETPEQMYEVIKQHNETYILQLFVLILECNQVKYFFNNSLSICTETYSTYGVYYPWLITNRNIPSGELELFNLGMGVSLYFYYYEVFICLEEDKTMILKLKDFMHSLDLDNFFNEYYFPIIQEKMEKMDHEDRDAYYERLKTEQPAATIIYVDMTKGQLIYANMSSLLIKTENNSNVDGIVCVGILVEVLILDDIFEENEENIKRTLHTMNIWKKIKPEQIEQIQSSRFKGYFEFYDGVLDSIQQYLPIPAIKSPNFPDPKMEDGWVVLQQDSPNPNTPIQTEEEEKKDDKDYDKLLMQNPPPTSEQLLMQNPPPITEQYNFGVDVHEEGDEEKNKDNGITEL